jgi:hypothetical protein
LSLGNEVVENPLTVALNDDKVEYEGEISRGDEGEARSMEINSSPF